MFADQLLILGGLSLFAILSGLLASRFRLPFALGLMLVGAVIGPNVLGLLNDAAIIDLLIEFGAVLFLFGIGLEFSLKRLLSTGPAVLLVTAFKVGVMFFLGFTVTMLLGFGAITAAFMGVALSFSSTMIILNVLKQQGLYRREEVPLIMGVLILEDIFGVIALTFLATAPGGFSMEAIIGMENLVLGLIILAIVYIVMSNFAETIVKWLIRNAGDETIIFISIGLCTGMAFLAHFLSLSPSAGAFLAGSVASAFRQSRDFERSIQPYTFIFTSFFFIGIGTMFDIGSVLASLPFVLVLVALVLVAQPVAMGVSARLFGRLSDNQAFFAGAVMLPPGVFSLLVAKEAISYGVTIDLVSIISTLMIVQTLILSFSVRRIMSMSLPRALTKHIEGVSNNIRIIVEGFRIETTHTRNYRQENARLLFHLTLIILPLILFLRLAHHTGSLWLFIIAGCVTLVTVVYGVRRAKETELILRRIILHSASRTALRAFRQTKYGLFFLLLGLYSPLVIYLINGNILYLVLSVALCVFGIRKLLIAEDIIKGRVAAKPTKAVKSALVKAAA